MYTSLSYNSINNSLVNSITRHSSNAALHAEMPRSIRVHDVRNGEREGRCVNILELQCNAVHRTGWRGCKNLQTAALTPTPVSKTFPQTSVLITRWCAESFCFETLDIRFPMHLQFNSMNLLVTWPVFFLFFLPCEILMRIEACRL